MMKDVMFMENKEVSKNVSGFYKQNHFLVLKTNCLLSQKYLPKYCICCGMPIEQLTEQTTVRANNYLKGKIPFSISLAGVA